MSALLEALGPALHLHLGVVDALISLAISAAMAAASYFLMRPKKAKKPHANQPDLPISTTATQGAYVPLLYGRRRIGALVAWVGGRKAVPVFTRVSKGPLKGNRSKKRATGEINYFESRWDLLCVGPAKRLRKIWQDGRVVFNATHLPQGGLTPENTPSGTLVSGGGNGDFYVFWGESDQALNSLIDDRIGINSRWPHVCSVYWVDKPLGSVPRWPQLDYDLEVTIEGECTDGVRIIGGTESAVGGGNCDLTYAGLGSTSETFDEAGDSFVVATAGWYRFKYEALDSDANTVSGAAGVSTSNLDPSSIEWTDARIYLDDGTTEVDLLVETATVTIADPPVANDDCWDYYDQSGIWSNAVAAYRRLVSEYVYLTAGTWTIRASGTIDDPDVETWAVDVKSKLYRIDSPVVSGGASFGPLMRKILFSPFPHGIGLSEADFDLEALDAVSAALDAEGLNRFTVFAQDGDEFQNVIGNLMQDAGVFWTRDPITGKEKFYLVREEADPIPTLVEDQILPVEAEIEVVHAERAVDRAMYAFTDVSRAFRDTVYGVDDDGQPTDTGNVRGTVGRISTLIDAYMAGIVVERRSQEELASPARITVYAGRDARVLHPGQAISVPGVPYVLRVAEVGVDVLTSKVKLDCAPDHYGAPATTYEPPVDYTIVDGSADDVAANLREDWIEIPEALGGPGVVQIAALRVRAHDQILQQAIHLSGDGSTYKEVTSDGALMVGGVLLEGIAATADWEIATGPTFTLQGPDVEEVLDLSGSDGRWRRGDQVCAIGDELFFLQKITAVSGSTYRLDGLIRARFDTARATHAIGAKVFIFQDGALQPQIDALVAPGQTLYVKQQPSSPVEQLSLASVSAISATVYGKGLVPPAPCALDVTAPVLGAPSYSTGQDVVFTWASRLADPPFCGAGMNPVGTVAFDAGEVHANTVFEVRVYDSGDTLVATYLAADGVTSTGWTYDNADLQTDLGGETDFSIEVYEVRAGLYSGAASLSVEVI